MNMAISGNPASLSDGKGRSPRPSVMVFDGENSVVTLSQPLPPLPAGVTIEFWARGADDLPRATSIFAAWRADGARVLNIHLPWSNGLVYWDAGNDDGAYDRIQKAAEPGEYQGTWTHWAFVKDVARGEMSIYRNGALWHRESGRTKPIADGALAIIGAFVDGGYKWSGRLAEFRIWDRPRTEAELAAARSRRLTGPEPGLLGGWPLDEIDPDGMTPDLAGQRPGAVRGATIAPDDTLAAALTGGTAPAPATAVPSAAAEGQAQGGPSDSVLVTVLRHNDGRKRRLVRLKLERMAHDPFAFFRGADHLYADAWPDLQPPDPGPEIPICGDLHLENFGAYRSDEGELLFDINDFDEAVVAPCSLDLVRCATSILLAAELWRLTPLQASGMVLVFLDGYRSTIRGSVTELTLDARVPRLLRGPVGEILGRAALTSQADLLDRHTVRLRNGQRRILRRKNHHRAIKAERAATIRAAVKAYGDASRQGEFYEPLDVTSRIAGVGSLGLRRYTLLVAGGGSSRTNRLFDLKECRPSALQSCASRPWPFPDASDAARVVRAQRMLQATPTAGLDVLQVGETLYRFREMIPEENRSSLDRFNKKPEKLRVAIEEAGLLTALSHHRGAEASPEGSAVDALARWAEGPALDSVLAAAVRFAERSRVAHRQFRAERRSPAALPASLRKQYGR